MSSTSTLQARVDGGQKRSLVIGAVGLVVFAIIGVLTKDSGNLPSWQLFLHAYVVAFAFVAAITIGSLGVLMIHNMTGGWWGYPLRRIFEASARTLPLIIVLFLPLAFGMSHLYEWARPEVVQGDTTLQMKAWYLNSHGFIIRAVVYFAIWAFLIYRLTGFSAREDETGDPSLAHRMEATSAPGLVIGAVTVTVAAIDWIMSMQARWYSTIYGFLFIVIFLLAAHSFAIITFNRLSKDYEPLKDSIEPSRYLDVGNLLLTFTILWTYLSFSQFLIIWAGNLKQEIPYYTSRAFGGWGVFGALLLIFHFFVPFFMLLQRSIKRHLPRLAKVAMIQLGMTVVDLYWQVFPAYESGPRFGDLAIVFAVLGLGGIWMFVFLGQLKRLPLLPLHDPRFAGRAPAIPPVSEFLHIHGRRPEA